MGVYHTTYAIIGVKIKATFPKQVIVEKSCLHETDRRKFCPECGKEVKLHNREVTSDEESDFRDHMYNAGGKLYRTVDLSYHNQTRGEWIIGYGLSVADGDYEHMDMPNIEDVKEAIRAMLGLDYAHFYTEDSFGLWAVDYYA